MDNLHIVWLNLWEQWAKQVQHIFRVSAAQDRIEKQAILNPVIAESGSVISLADTSGRAGSSLGIPFTQKDDTALAAD